MCTRVTVLGVCVCVCVCVSKEFADFICSLYVKMNLLELTSLGFLDFQPVGFDKKPSLKRYHSSQIPILS